MGCPGPGPWGSSAPARSLVVVEPLPVVELVDVAALAIAAPPPAIAAGGGERHQERLEPAHLFTSFRFSTTAHVPLPASDPGRRRVRVCLGARVDARLWRRQRRVLRSRDLEHSPRSRSAKPARRRAGPASASATPPPPSAAPPLAAIAGRSRARSHRSLPRAASPVARAGGSRRCACPPPCRSPGEPCPCRARRSTPRRPAPRSARARSGASPRAPRRRPSTRE